MISVQNRLPEPGKENRVSITPDNGSAVEGVLAYADDATQEGTFWNRKTAQLLQGDIRTYPVREGQSISAGDVVNVGREVVSGTTYGDLAVGSTVQINENGSPVDYLVVHQGNPDPELYDTSCNGTWLLRKDIAENRVWDAGNSNVLESSDIQAYLNGDWMSRYGSDTLDKIKTVKIPYRQNGGSSGTDQSGENGLSCRIFLLSGYEVGWTIIDHDMFPVDGSKLSYFELGTGSSANNKRIATLNGSASDWYLRSPRTYDTYVAWRVLSNGNYGTNSADDSSGVRPAFIFDSSALTGDNLVYGPETVYKDVVAQDNVETKISTYAATDTDVIMLNQSYSVVGYTLQNNGAHCTLLSNDDNSIVFPIALNAGNNISSVSLARLDDSHFVVQFQVGNGLYSKIGTVSGNSITLGNDRVIDQPLSNTDRNNAILSLSQSFALSIYNSSGIQVKFLTISGNQIPTVSAAYSLPSNTGANYISACRLPDEGGNKRVCICFADSSDGNNGKAVIATIDSSNVVTFGDVLTFNESDTSYISCDADSNSLVISYINSNSKLSACLLSLNGGTLEIKNSISTVEQDSSVTSGRFTTTHIFSNYLVISCQTGNNGGKSYVLSIQNDTLIYQSAFVFNKGNTYHGSSDIVEDSKLIFSYADGGNSNYGTTTILEIFGNQIAGSFIDTSKDAIALADGTGGQSIPVGFGGYCECPGVTEGDTIDSSGVWAYSPNDGWLKIVDAQEKRVITGTFTTGQAGTINSVNLGFKPSVVMVYDYNNNTNASSIPGASGSQANTMNCIRIIATETGNTKLTDTGFNIVLNVLKPLWYVAWR